MKQTWEQLGAQAHQVQEILSEILEVLPQSPQMLKRKRTMNKEWEKFKRIFNKFDGFVTPVDSVNVKEPWNDPEFLETWQYWKEYLIEQHGVFMRSRSEVMALKHLKNITDNNPKTAIKYLEFAMAGRYPNFFKLDEKETTTENTDEHGKKKPTVVKLGQ